MQQTRILVSACLMDFKVHDNGTALAAGRMPCPTCGTQQPGMGATAAPLEQHGIRVFSAQQLPALMTWVEEREKP